MPPNRSRIDRDPTRLERRTMEKFCMTWPCVYAHEGGSINHIPWELHDMCPGTFVRDLHATPDDWQQCQCPCHAGQPHAGRGTVVLRKLPPRPPTPLRKH